MGTPNELKATFKGKLLEVVCDPLMDGLDILSKTDFVSDIPLFGASLHVTVSDDEYAVPLIESELNIKNVKIQKIETVSPSLEDVFVSLIESKEKNHYSDV